MSLEEYYKSLVAREEEFDAEFFAGYEAVLDDIEQVMKEEFIQDLQEKK